MLYNGNEYAKLASVLPFFNSAADQMQPWPRAQYARKFGAAGVH